jgi:hypothetical protein
VHWLFLDRVRAKACWSTFLDERPRHLTNQTAERPRIAPGPWLTHSEAAADTPPAEAVVSDGYSTSAFDSTLRTPRMFCASSMASARSAPLSTLPLRVTTPSAVATEMSLPLTLREYM